MTIDFQLAGFVFVSPDKDSFRGLSSTQTLGTSRVIN